METLYSPDLKIDNLELEDNNKQVSVEIVTAESVRDNSIVDNSIEFSEKQELSPSTPNSVSTQDETVETKEEKTESEITSEHNDKVES